MTIITTELEVVRENLLELLSSGAAHIDFDSAIADLPARLRGGKPSGQPHTPWRLVEHMRISQWDILEFCTNPAYASLDWPAEYWPEGDGPPNAVAWNRSLRAFRRDLQSMKELVADPATDLLARIPHGQGQTIHREAMLVADHNAYHLGQLIMVRRLLGAWE